LLERHRARCLVDADMHRLYGKGGRISEAVEAIDRAPENGAVGRKPGRLGIRRDLPGATTVFDEGRDPMQGFTLVGLRGEFSADRSVSVDSALRQVASLQRRLSEEILRRVAAPWSARTSLRLRGLTPDTASLAFSSSIRQRTGRGTRSRWMNTVPRK
jgi:hypothetical protein